MNGVAMTGKFLALAVLVITVAGCESSEQVALEQWMKDQRSSIKPNVPRIAEPTKFVPEPYRSEAVTEPFSNAKLTQALKKESSQATANAALIAPELSRRKEPLEAFPLDAVNMVGTLVKTGQPVALVKVDNLLYQVRVGSYLGQNYGRVTKITESDVALREIVQDAAGEWIERVATLQLQERSK
jgi:type IV pilus assembly protein PilP